MARPLRLHFPGMAYHVVARGNQKHAIFEDDADYERFLVQLGRSVERFAVTCLAYCLLWNHYHLLLICGELAISRLMQHLNSAYCQWFNRRHDRVGHVLQGRFGSRIVDNHAYLLTALRYIARNPVAANRVAQPEDWRWGSYRATAGLCAVPSFLAVERVWNTFDTANPKVGQERFRTFVASVGDCEDLSATAVFFGGERLAEEVETELAPHRQTCDFVYAERFAARPPLERLLAGRATRLELEDAARIAFCQHAYTLREIGQALGRPAGTMWSWVKRSEARHTRELRKTRPSIQVQGI